MKILTLALVILVSQGAYNARAADLTVASHVRPDPKLTPGATNPDITQANIRQTICNNHGKGKHWTTKLIRPPASYTTKLKKQQLAENGYTDRDPSHFEEDHLISLQLAGHPRDPKNLWPESYAGKYGARIKDKVENAAHSAVCSGALSLKEAQRKIATDWISFGRELKVLK